MKSLKFIILGILIIGWMILIFSFSSQDVNKSLDTSDRFLIKIIETIKGRKLTQTEIKLYKEKFILLIRKSAHFFLYFVLGAIAFLIVKEIYGLKLTTVLLALAFCVLYACTDEFHQYFVEGRSAQVLDVFIDSCGSLLSITILCILIYIKRFIVSIFRKKKEII